MINKKVSREWIDMVLLVTGAMTPQVLESQICIKNINERKEQYLEALNSYIESGAVSKIVYCDNSNVDLHLFDRLKTKAIEQNVEFEILSFMGNAKMVETKGKGYGEGEITQYALEHSRLLLDDNYLIKLTGRLYIDNLFKIIRRLHENRVYFNINKKTLRNFCDTRFYAMPISVYREKFMNVYQKVNDVEGHYLEHSFYDTLKDNKMQSFNFPLYPRYRGVSGSTGAQYTYSEWKCILKDVLSKIQYYRVHI